MVPPGFDRFNYLESMEWPAVGNADPELVTRRMRMPMYMLQFSYTPETWAALLRKPEDRTGAVDALVKSAGGRLVSVFYHFGEFDGTVIAELPDDAAANAVVFATVASGALRSSRTTRLFSPKEVVDSLGKAGKAAYRPPGKS
jgi:uncharacterized protein with GYD domain